MANTYNIGGKEYSDVDAANAIATGITSGKLTKEQGLELTKKLQEQNKATPIIQNASVADNITTTPTVKKAPLKQETTPQKTYFNDMANKGTTTTTPPKTQEEVAKDIYGRIQSGEITKEQGITEATNASKTQTQTQPVVEKTGVEKINETLTKFGGAEEVIKKLKERVTNGTITIEQYNGFLNQIKGEGVNIDENAGKTTQDFYKAISTGVDIGNEIFLKDNSAYQAAKVRKSAFDSFDKSEKGITTAINAGTLNKDLTLYQDLIDGGYGEVIKKAEQAKVIAQAELKAAGMGGEISDKNPGEMTNSEFQEYVSAVMGKLLGDYYTSWKTDYENNSVLTSGKEQAKKDYAKLQQLTLEKTQLYDRLVAENPSASTQYISALYNRAKYDLDTRINEVSGNIAGYEGMVKTELSILKDKYEVRKDIEDKKMSTFKDLLSYKMQEDTQQHQIELANLNSENDIKRIEAEQKYEDEKYTKELAWEQQKYKLEQIGKGIDISTFSGEQLRTYNTALSYIPESYTASQKDGISKQIASLVAQGQNIETIKGYVNVSAKEDVKNNSTASIDLIFNNLMKGNEYYDDEKAVLDGLIAEYGPNSDVVKSQLKMYAKEKAGVTESQKITNLEDNLTAMYNIQKVFNEMSTNDYNLIKATANTAAKTIGQAVDLEKAKAEGLSKTALNAYTNAVSGVSFSEKEASRYASLFPEAKDGKDFANMKIVNLINDTQRQLDSVYGTLMNKTAYAEFFQGQDVSTPTDTTSDVLNEDSGVKYEGKTYTKNDLLFIGRGTVIPTSLKQVSPINTVGGLECGEYINKAFGLTGDKKLGDYYADTVVNGKLVKGKLSKMDTVKEGNQVVKANVGDIVVFKPKDTGDIAKYGHTGFVIGEEGDYYLVKSSNYTKGGTITVDRVLKSKIGGKLTTDEGEAFAVEYARQKAEQYKNTGITQNFLGGAIAEVPKIFTNIGATLLQLGNISSKITPLGITADTIDRFMNGGEGRKITDMAFKSVIDVINKEGSDAKGGLQTAMGINPDAFSTKAGEFAPQVIAALVGDKGLSKLSGGTKLGAWALNLAKTNPTLKNKLTNIAINVIGKGVIEGGISQGVTEGEITKEGLTTGLVVNGLAKPISFMANKLIPKEAKQVIIDSAQKLIKYKNAGNSASVIQKQTDNFIEAASTLKNTFGDRLKISKGNALEETLETVGNLKTQVFKDFYKQVKNSNLKITDAEIDDAFFKAFDENTIASLKGGGVTEQQILKLRDDMSSGDMEKVYGAIKSMKEQIYSAQGVKESGKAKAALKFAEELDNIIQSKLGKGYSKFKSEYSSLKAFEDNIGKQLKKYYGTKDSWFSGAADNEFIGGAFIDAVRGNYLGTAKNIYQEISKNMKQSGANPNKLLYDIFKSMDDINAGKTSLINKNTLNNAGNAMKSIINTGINNITK